MKEPVNYVVEVDIKKFFDSVSLYWLLRCIEERVADPNMIWLIKRFLKAGVVESEVYQVSEIGTTQGGLCKVNVQNL